MFFLTECEVASVCIALEELVVGLRMGQWVGEPVEREPVEREPVKRELAERAAVQPVGVCPNSQFADFQRPYYQNTFPLVRIVHTDD